MSFRAIPESSKLFLDFLYAFPKVSRYYSQPPFALSDLLSRPEPQQSPEQRTQIAEILREQNRSWGASEKTFENIELLKQGASAVVTGQQVILFGGPAYVMYKALTAIHLARQASEAGTKCVPIFWMATEDHDLAEVNHAFFPTMDGGLNRLTTASQGKEDEPVGGIKFEPDIEPHLSWIKESFGDCEICSILEESYRPGSTFAESFARLLTRTFSQSGLILIDPSDARFHKIAAPLYAQVIRQSAEINRQLIERNKELEATGYHAQVKVTESTSLLFCTQEQRRVPVQRRNGKFVIEHRTFSPEELQEEIARIPERFSPNALLRPVIQDFLLPTKIYIGGPAEIAYFAQSQVLYEQLLRRTTPILPRFSATLIEARIVQWLNKYHLEVKDMLRPETQIQSDLARRALPQDLKQRFEETKTKLDTMLEPLKESLRKLDPTIAEAAEGASRKMHYQLEQLAGRAAQAEMRRNSEIARHSSALAAALYPEKGLQERAVSWVYFLARYDNGVKDDLAGHIRPECPDHQLIAI